MTFFKLLIGLLSCFAAPNRISEISKDLGRADKIYLSPGLSSKIEFSGPISEVIVGNPQSLKAPISPTNPKALIPYFTSSGSIPTNLIVTVGRKVFVFDVLPSKGIHQDYIRIRNAYRGSLMAGQTITGGAIVSQRVQRRANLIQSISLGGEE